MLSGTAHHTDCLSIKEGDNGSQILFYLQRTFIPIKSIVQNNTAKEGLYTPDFYARKTSDVEKMNQNLGLTVTLPIYRHDL